MRVDYTLPALQPATLPDAPEVQGGKLSFREQLRGLAGQVPSSVEEQLRLDKRPFTASYIGPPPRPKTLDLNDSESQGARWRDMLARHSQGRGSGTDTLAAPERPSVQMMLEMLTDMQDMGDGLLAQSVSVTRG